MLQIQWKGKKKSHVPAPDHLGRRRAGGPLGARRKGVLDQADFDDWKTESPSLFPHPRQAIVALGQAHAVAVLAVCVLDVVVAVRLRGARSGVLHVA